jgi:hypothetical protein
VSSTAETTTTPAAAPVPPPAPETAPAAAPPAAAPHPGFLLHHEDDGGDGRYHLATPDACTCGAPHVGSVAPLKQDDPVIGFKPPEMFCDPARASLSTKQQVAAQTQAIAQQAQKEAVPFEPRDTGEMFRYASFLARSNLIPKSLLGKPSDILVVLLKGRDLGLTPMQSIAGINVIDGKAEVGALTMVALIRKSGLCEEWRLVHSDTKRAVFSTKRRGDSEFTIFEYTIEEAESAGLTTKGYNPAKSPWNTQRRTMLRRRCQSMLAREVYPDIVGGLYDHDELTEMRELETELIKTGMRAAAAGFHADPAMTPPAWMEATAAGTPANTAPEQPAQEPPPAASSAPPAVEVLSARPAPAPAAPPKPVDPLKQRLAKKAQAARPAEAPSLFGERTASDVQPDPLCKGCGVPIDPPKPGEPQQCEACRNS